MSDYQIIRFSQDRPNRVVKSGLTLEQARDHCNRDDTRGPGWFDGYQEEEA